MTYLFLDSGNEQKLEQFGAYTVVRPSANALWKPTLSTEKWESADMRFSRKKGNRWVSRKKLPSSWTVESGGIQFKLSPTDFGHLGLFPEHIALCQWMIKIIQNAEKQLNVLNLFAYSGAATLFAAKAGAKVCHLDASKGMVHWANENAKLNNLQDAPIRWIVDDVMKFLKREKRRGVQYDGIILDPPSFGRGSEKEMFKIERDLVQLLQRCKDVLSHDPKFVILSSHTPGLTPLSHKNLLAQMMDGCNGNIEEGEMVLCGKSVPSLPCGSYSRWKR